MAGRTLTDPAHYDLLCPDDDPEMSCDELYEYIPEYIVDSDCGPDSANDGAGDTGSESSADEEAGMAYGTNVYPGSDNEGDPDSSACVFSG